MNAPLAKNLLTRTLEGAYELIPLASIVPSATYIQKLRRERYNMESLADLRVSIAQLGVQQPVIVRKLDAQALELGRPAMQLGELTLALAKPPRGTASYELVAGERRFRAASQAGLAHIPAIVRVFTDGEVLEVQLVENLQREDLHPLEEAAGYEELMKVGNLKKEDLGEKVGKSRSWVYSRLNLLKLPKDARQALQSGAIDVSRALMVASIADPARQAEVLSKALQRTHNNNPTFSVRQLRADVLKERITFPLVGAPFPAMDPGLIPEAADADVCTNVPCYEAKVAAHGDRRRKEVLARGGKVLRGEDARLISPSVNTVYGHVDLDLVCDWDEFPEPAPKAPKDMDEYGDEYDQLPEVIAWREREEAWQPRTYRALLDGQKHESVLLDDPKTKLLRELVPFKQAQQLLKKKGIDLPSHANRKRQVFQRSSASTPANSKRDPAAEKAAREAEEKKRESEEAIQKEIAVRVLTQVKAKHDGKLGVAELVFLGDRALQDDMPDEGVALWPLFGLKDPGWQVGGALEKCSSKDLPKLLAAAVVAMDLFQGFRDSGKVAKQILQRLKIDTKAIEKKVREEIAAKAKGKKT